MKRLDLFLFLLITVLPGCRTKVATDEAAAPVAGDTLVQRVEVIVARVGDFAKEVVTGGKVEALKTPLFFRTGAIIKDIRVSNGQRVRKGDYIAALEPEQIENQYQQAKYALDQAGLQFEDLLLSMGFSLADTATMPEKILATSKIKSGLGKALSDFRFAQWQLQTATMVAPTDGIVAGITLRQGDMADPSKPFCYVLAPGATEVSFQILETEADRVSPGMPVIIRLAFADSVAYKGTLLSVNPVVEPNGLVRCRARCPVDGILMDGMNVQVTIRDVQPGYLAIPKDAMVLRSGKKVVFTARGGRAKWNYISTGMENTQFVTITEGLSAGDSVIVRGNVNLAHDSRIEVEEE